MDLRYPVGRFQYEPLSASGRLTLDMNIALYAWHGRHHVAHITSLRNRTQW